MMSRHLAAFAIVLAIGPLALPVDAQSAFWSGLRAGPHPVGFRLLDTVDVTRSFPSAAGAMAPRPVRLYVWYPALPGATGPRVTWGEIIRENYPLHSPPEDPQGFVRRQYVRADSAIATARLDSLGTLPMLARRGARAATGPFPVVLLTPAWPGGFLVAAELLASHGFVVIGTAQRSGGTVEALENTPNLTSIDAEVEDLEFTLGAARSWRNADAAKVGVMGFSSGSLSAIAFTFRSRVPSAVISVEGWEGAEAGVPIITGYRHFEPARFTAAFVRIGTAVESPSPAFRKTTAFFDSIRFAPRWRVEVDSALHGDFQGLSLQSREVFKRTNQYVLAFFRANLGTTPSSAWPPTPRTTGITVQTFPMAAADPGREEFFRLAETRPGEALATLRRLRQRDAEAAPPFTEGSLNRLANSTRDRRPSDAAIINEIVTLGYPASARAFARLSDAYWGLGRLDEARVAARQALDRIDRDSALGAEQRDALRTRMQTRATSQ